jgi:hypothetical protein
MTDHFYLTLPSNAGARYVTKLPERIRLDDDYEVGLSELVYPHTWYNVNNRGESTGSGCWILQPIVSSRRTSNPVTIRTERNLPTV